MDKKELLADLRNKLSPMKNYFEMLRDYQQLESSKESSSLAYLQGMKMAELKPIIQQEQRQSEKNMAQIEYIIEQLEKD